MTEIADWQDSFSDGCSAKVLPSWLRNLLLPDGETPELRKVCLWHDFDYYYGGSAEERWAADADLYDGLVDAGLARWRAALCWLGVRLFGGPSLHRFSTWVLGRPQAWAWGGSVFKYT